MTGAVEPTAYWAMIEPGHSSEAIAEQPGEEDDKQPEEKIDEHPVRRPRCWNSPTKVAIARVPGASWNTVGGNVLANE